MSPRMILKVEDCPYCECEQHFSIERGTVTVTYICHHPENEDVVCAHRGSEVVECRFVRKAEEAAAGEEAAGEEPARDETTGE